MTNTLPTPAKVIKGPWPRHVPNLSRFLVVRETPEGTFYLHAQSVAISINAFLWTQNRNEALRFLSPLVPNNLVASFKAAQVSTSPVPTTYRVEPVNA